MALIDLWKSDREQILQKKVRQLITFAGPGRLLDGNPTSHELRAISRIAPSDLLERWINEILEESFEDSGLALQDLVNEIGSRLGFEVTPGLYRGKKDGANYDGIWKSPDGRTLIVESKTSTAFQINLAKVAGYRSHLHSSAEGDRDEFAVLLVVGRNDTESLESQIRGSRYAWNIRLIGVDALLRLLKLKETLEDSAVERQIRSLLFPQEFTRLDSIIDLVFETSEDVQNDASPELPTPEADGPRKKPANFHLQILPLLERHFGQPLVKRGRVIWKSLDEAILVSCQVATERNDKPGENLYWFGLKRKTAEVLQAKSGSLAAFGLGSAEIVVALPYELLQKNLDRFFNSPDESGGVFHWHVRFTRDGNRVYLLTNKDRDRLEVTQHLIKSHQRSQ